MKTICVTDKERLIIDKELELVLFAIDNLTGAVLTGSKAK